MGSGGGIHQPSVPTHLPAVGVSQRAAVDLVKDVASQHHLVHLRLAPGEHLGDKDSAVHIPGGVQPSPGSALGTQPGSSSPFIPSAMFHRYTEAGKSHPTESRYWLG